jgi:hypothetical protein
VTVDLESLKRHLDEDERLARQWFDRRCDGCGRAVAARGLYGLVKCTACDPGDMPVQAPQVLHWVAAARKVLAGFEAVANNPDRLTDAALHLQFNVLRQVVEAIASVYGEET